MVFPHRLNINTHIYVVGEDFGGPVKRFVDISTRPLGENGVKIGRGRPNEQGKVRATNDDLTLKNSDGLFSPRYPLSTYYGNLGKNIKLRHIVSTHSNIADTFSRVQSDSWATADLAWQLAGGANTDYDVNGTDGTITFTDTNVRRTAYIDAGANDYLVRAIFDLSQDDITGAGVAATIRGRFTDNNNYYGLNFSYSTSELVSVSLVKTVGGVSESLTDSDTFNLAGIATADVMGELYIEGNRIYGKYWRRVNDEILSWQLSAEDNDLATGTNVGIGGIRATGNTNANLQVRVSEFYVYPGTIRASLEIPSFSQRSDSTGEFKYTPIQAAGIKRRLGKGQRPLRSALWRELLFSNPKAMWPINDGKNSPWAASALSNGDPMSIQTLDSASNPIPLSWEPIAWNDWVEPIATATTGGDIQSFYGRGPINMDSSVTSWAADFVFAIEIGSEFAIARLTVEGPGEGTIESPRTDWQFWIGTNTDDFLTWEVVRNVVAGTTTETSVATGTISILDSRIHHMRLLLTQNGANTEWELLIDNSTVDSGILAAVWGAAVWAVPETGAIVGRASIGFVTIWDHSTPPGNAANAAVVGRSGELAADRLARLFEEEGIAFELMGEASDTAAMGPQRLVTLLQNAEDCEATDMGILSEPRHFFGFMYRTRRNLYSQTSMFELDYSASHLSESLDDTDDEFHIQNDVELSRPNGSSYRVVQETGPLNIQNPEDDSEGAGLYDVAEPYYCDLDSQLPAAAEWRKHLGTFDRQVRFPKVVVALHRAEIYNDEDLLENICRLREGDIFTITNPLSPPHAPDDLVFMCEGSDEFFWNFGWKFTWNTSPGGIYTIGTYNDTANLSRYDTNKTTVTAQITTGVDTSMQFTTEAGGDLWITGSSSPEFPFDIDLLGVRVRVTAISGASSPQTVTISSTVVNGLSKVIPAGTQVKLWDDVRYGL